MKKITSLRQKSSGLCFLRVSRQKLLPRGARAESQACSHVYAPSRWHWFWEHEGLWRTLEAGHRKSRRWDFVKVKLQFQENPRIERIRERGRGLASWGREIPKRGQEAIRAIGKGEACEHPSILEMAVPRDDTAAVKQSQPQLVRLVL